MNNSHVATPPFPQGPYNIILADPPWHYNDKATAGNRGVAFKYPVLTTIDIAALPIPQIAAANCALFLWATPPNLPAALRVMDAWEFTYKTIAFVWVKTTNGVGEPSTRSLTWGMGNYTRANAEIVLLGIKGKLQRQSAAVHQVVFGMRREHSRKPDEVRTRIEQLYGDVPRIELFARSRVADWDGWGNEYPTIEEKVSSNGV